jgi:subtilisin family serine protease
LSDPEKRGFSPLVVKSAGNDRQNLSESPETKDMSADSLRYIIFAGNLPQNTSQSTHSGTPGENPLIQDRFLWTTGTNLRVAAGSTGKATYEYASGTSLAAPTISGVAALIKSAFPEMPMDQVAECLLESADQDFFVSGKNGYKVRHVVAPGNLTVEEPHTL